MFPKEPKIGKQAAAGITRHTTITIPGTLEIIKKPGRATIQSVNIAAYMIGLLTIYSTKKYKEKITCKNLVQYRYFLMINGIFNDVASLQFCGCQIK